MTGRGLLLAAAISVLGGTLAAQPATPAPVGSRIRFRAMLLEGYLGKRLEGTVLRVSGDTLLVLPRLQQLDTLSVFLNRDAELFVSVTRRRDAIRGGMIGAVAGLLTAGLLGSVQDRSCSERLAAPFCADPGTPAPKRAIILTGVGAIGGTLIGILASHEIWKLSNLEPALSLGPRGGKLGLSVEF